MTGTSRARGPTAADLTRLMVLECSQLHGGMGGAEIFTSKITLSDIILSYLNMGGQNNGALKGGENFEKF